MIDQLVRETEAIRPVAVEATPIVTPSSRTAVLARLTIVVLVVATHLATDRHSEPFYNVDETRNVMTGVFFRDLVADHPIDRPVGYTIDYYLQYPALGLLLWPPFFHVVLGGFMLVFGTSMAVAKGVILLFSVLACDFTFRLVRHTHGMGTAVVTSAILGVSPMFYEFSSQVMLEVPTLASVVAAVYYFVLYLDRGLRRDVYFACLVAALAVLTRFDGAQLALTFLFLCLAKRRVEVLWSRHFLIASALALAVTVPVYALIFSQVGEVHSQNISAGFNPDATSPFHPRNFAAYLAWIPDQMGWFAYIPAVIGLFACLWPSERKPALPYLAMFFASYLMIVSVAEILDRHAIYWGPPLALFAARGLWLVANGLRRQRLFPYFSAVVIGGTMVTTLQKPVPYVFGYEHAARYVSENTTRSPYCLFDRYMNGNFIYQIRRTDPSRKIGVLRADKILYSTLIDPENQYQEFVQGEAEILKALDDYGPEYIVLEEGLLLPPLPVATALRGAIHAHPERYPLVASIPVRSNIATFEVTKINIYKNTLPLGPGSKPLKFFSQTLGRSLGAGEASSKPPATQAH